MPIGPGKYDDLCTYVRKQAGAAGVLVIVLDGKKGHGFSAQLPTTFDGSTVAALLREMAGQIERDYPGPGRV